VLDNRPKLDYLHVAELRSPHWRKQHGIREIDAERKIDEAFRLIRNHRSLYPITAHLNADHFKSAMARGKVKMRIKTAGGVAWTSRNVAASKVAPQSNGSTTWWSARDSLVLLMTTWAMMA